MGKKDNVSATAKISLHNYYKGLINPKKWASSWFIKENNWHWKWYWWMDSNE